MRVHAVIQARHGSTRLPGKVLRPLGGHSVLAWVVRAARQAHGVDEVVVATSAATSDDAVADEARRLGAEVVRGSELDVLDRFAAAVAERPCDAVVRLTADCPFLDPVLIGQVVALWRADPEIDYVATTLVRTLPRGLDVELIRTDLLLKLWRDATGHDRVHVTSAAYAPGSQARCAGLVVSPSAQDLRVTLDTAEDAAALDAIALALGDEPVRWTDIVAFLRRSPDVVALNAHVPQKSLQEG